MDGKGKRVEEGKEEGSDQLEGGRWEGPRGYARGGGMFRKGWDGKKKYVCVSNSQGKTLAVSIQHLTLVR